MLQVNWCRTCGRGQNYGDQLTPALLSHYEVPYEWSPPGVADLLLVGSILSKIPSGWAGMVLGTGLIREGLSRDLSRAQVLAVRGPLTRDACRLPADTLLGDAGILAPRIVPDLQLTEEHPTGVLPHHVDLQMAKRHPRAYLIDVHLPPAEVVRAVARCRHLITSSLHGLITADALGIPCTYEPHPAVIGDGWKFRDYLGAFQQTVEPGVRRQATPRTAMLERQDALEALVAGLK